MVDTKVTISLRKRLVKIHTSRRLKKTPDYLRERAAKLANVPIENVKISKEVNDLIMIHISRRMKSSEFILSKEDGKVTVNVVKKAQAPQKTEAKPASGKKTTATAAPAAQKPASVTAPAAKPKPEAKPKKEKEPAKAPAQAPKPAAAEQQ